MQKFRSNDFKSIYEDVHKAPGFTHNPFAGVKDNGYGWHQYYSPIPIASGWPSNTVRHYSLHTRQSSANIGPVDDNVYNQYNIYNAIKNS